MGRGWVLHFVLDPCSFDPVSCLRKMPCGMSRSGRAFGSIYFIERNGTERDDSTKMLIFSKKKLLITIGKS